MTADRETLQRTIVEIPGNDRPDGAEIVLFDGLEGRCLRACIAPAPIDRPTRGTAIVCPGRTEFIEKYFEVARDLQSRGFAVLILDWPGQGLSDRLLDDSLKGHIDRFDTFMNALRAGLERAEERLPKPYVCVAHSMGGGIALAAIIEQYVKVAAAAFSAPMWGIRGRFWGIRYLVWAMRVLGRADNYAQQPGPPETFETNIVTHDEKRWRVQQALVEAAPDLGLGPVTWGWLGAVLNIFDTFAKPAKIRGIDIPVLVATASEEKLVDNAAHARIAGQLPNAEHIIVEGARHEILMETDEMRDQFWDAFDRLLHRAGV
ncbi:MAG: alpha/beta hydrolase [Pseudomonadota bacterium]